MAETKKTEKSEQEKRNEKLREAYAKEMENFELSSNEILDHVREKGVSIYAPNPLENAKQRPEEISDIHILFAQQLKEYAIEGTDDSEEQEKKTLEKAEEETSSNSSDDED